MNQDIVTHLFAHGGVPVFVGALFHLRPNFDGVRGVRGGEGLGGVEGEVDAADVAHVPDEHDGLLEAELEHLRAEGLLLRGAEDDGRLRQQLGGREDRLLLDVRHGPLAHVGQQREAARVLARRVERRRDLALVVAQDLDARAQHLVRRERGGEGGRGRREGRRRRGRRRVVVEVGLGDGGRPRRRPPSFSAAGSHPDGSCVGSGSAWVAVGAVVEALKKIEW